MKLVNNKSVGARLRTVRVGKKMTQVQFAKKFRIPKQNYVSRYECGRIPGPELLCRIATECGVSVDWILMGERTTQ